MKSRRVKLSDIAELTVGFVGNMAKQYKDEGVKFLRSLNIKPFSIVEDDLKYISREFNESLRKSILHENDLIIVRTGIPGTCCVVSKDYDGCNCADVVLVRPNLQVVNPHYLAAYINVWGKKQVEYNKVGAIQKHFNVKSAEEMLIDLPDLESQNKVAKILCDLNDKIISNEKINDYLEEMAKTIYDYWFVQFDFPDEDGKPYKSSGGKMVFCSELNQEIPQSWDYTSIGNISICLDSERIPLSNQQRQEMKGFIPYYGATGIVDYVNRPIFSGDYVLLAEDGSVMDGNGNPILQRVSGDVWVNNHTHVLQPVKGYSCRLLYLLLKDIPVAMIKTGSIQMKINQANLNNYNILNIPDLIRTNFIVQIEPIDAQIIQIQKENSNLTKIRDWLLPMLMNGQATIKD